MTIKHEIKVDKENKVLTLFVNIPRKKFAREENLSFNGADAWELAKGTNVAGHEVKYKKNGLIVDNWRNCNHTGTYVFPLEEKKLAKPKPAPVKPKLKTNDDKSNTKSKPKPRKSSTKTYKD